VDIEEKRVKNSRKKKKNRGAVLSSSPGAGVFYLRVEM
jgi:hypothetical protein